MEKAGVIRHQLAKNTGTNADADVAREEPVGPAIAKSCWIADAEDAEDAVLYLWEA